MILPPQGEHHRDNRYKCTNDANKCKQYTGVCDSRDFGRGCSRRSRQCGRHIETVEHSRRSPCDCKGASERIKSRVAYPLISGTLLDGIQTEIFANECRVSEFNFVWAGVE